MKPGPYQYCDECETERNHNWLETPNQNTYRCSACGKETTVKPRPPIPREAIFPGMGKIIPVGGNEMDHIDKEVQDEIQQNKPQPVAEVKKPVQVKEVGPTVHEPDLPKMGHEVKATPLEEKYKHLTYEEVSKKIGDAVHGEPGEVLDIDLSALPEPGIWIDEVNKKGFIVTDKDGKIPPTGKMYATEYTEHPNPMLSSQRIIIMDATEDPGPPFKEVNPKTMEIIEEKPKPSTGGWADAL